MSRRKLEKYHYGDTEWNMSTVTIEEGIATFASDQMEAADTGVDRTGWHYCDCPDCCARISAGFWISWTVEQVRKGTIKP